MEKRLFTSGFKLPGGFLLFIGLVIIFDCGVTFILQNIPLPYNKLTICLWRGYSTIGKLEYEILSFHRFKNGNAATMGWLKGRAEPKPFDLDSKDYIHVTSFGQSFTNYIVEQLRLFNPRIKIIKFAGPEVPLSWAFESYNINKQKYSADVRVIGFLEADISALTCLTFATFSPDTYTPYTFPRFKVKSNSHVKIEPLIKSFDEFRLALTKPELMEKFVFQLRENDALFDRYSYEKNFVDSSTILRWIRYNIAMGRLEKRKEEVAGNGTIDTDARMALKYILANFAYECHKEKSIPVVLIISAPGNGGNLKNYLKETIEKNKIICVSTSDVFNAADLSNYLPDGHIIQKRNEEVARHLAAVIHKAMEEKSEVADRK